MQARRLLVQHLHPNLHAPTVLPPITSYALGGVDKATRRKGERPSDELGEGRCASLDQRAHAQSYVVADLISQCTLLQLESASVTRPNIFR